MSKMSEIAMLLDDQAVELGFESYEEAIAKGYDVCYGEEGAYLYKLQPEDELLKAHKAWLEQRDDILDDLEHLKNIYKEVKPDENIIERTIHFIKEQCHD